MVGGFQTLARSGGLFDARSWSAQTGLPVLKRNELDPPVAPLLQIKGELVSAEAIENSLLRHPALAGHLHAPMGETATTALNRVGLFSAFELFSLCTFHKAEKDHSRRDAG